MELPKREWLGGKRQGLSSGWFDREGQEGVQVREGGKEGGREGGREGGKKGVQVTEGGRKKNGR